MKTYPDGLEVPGEDRYPDDSEVSYPDGSQVHGGSNGSDDGTQGKENHQDSSEVEEAEKNTNNTEIGEEENYPFNSDIQTEEIAQSDHEDTNTGLQNQDVELVKNAQVEIKSKHEDSILLGSSWALTSVLAVLLIVTIGCCCYYKKKAQENELKDDADIFRYTDGENRHMTQRWSIPPVM